MLLVTWRLPTSRHLVGDDQQGLGGEEGGDGVEQRRLLRDRVPARLADVQHVQHRRPQVRQRRDALRDSRHKILSESVD